MEITLSELKIMIIKEVVYGNPSAGDLQEIGEVLGIETKVTGLGIELLDDDCWTQCLERPSICTKVMAEAPHLWTV